MKTYSMKTIDNKLYIGDFKLEDLSNKYGSPLYVYDELGIRNKIDQYREGLKHDGVKANVVYASKAFIAPYLCDILKEKGCYIDAVSIGDLYLINKSKFPMKHVLLHGNNKSIEDLEYAIVNNVGLIVCDNYGELERLEELCKKHNKCCDTLFRVNPGVEAHTHKYIQTSKLDSKFGESIFDLDVIDKIMKFYQNSKYMNLLGFHAHIGSQITSNESFSVLADVMAKFYNDLYDKYKFNPVSIDFGGGIAIKYLDSDMSANIKDILKGMIDAFLKEINKNIIIKNIYVEPGRSIIGDSGVTLYKVGGIKETIAKRNYIFIDGGMPDNIRPALYEAKYSIDNASCVDGKLENRELKKYNVSGKCCESGDMIVRDYDFFTPKVGETLCTYSTGAYCYSMSMNYNGLVRPGVVFINNDKIKVAIRRETLEELVSTYVFD